MKLPKLYRVVYLELEWLTNTCEGGEHVQRSGYEYPRARLVIIDGMKSWQIIDKDRIPYGWEDYDFLYIDEMNWNWR